MIGLVLVAALAATPVRLDEVRLAARQNNVQALLAGQDFARASASRELGRSALLPQVSLTASAGGTVSGAQKSPQFVLKNRADPSQGGEIVATTLDPYQIPSFALGASFNQLLFDWSRFKTYAQTGLQVDAARGQLEEQQDLSEFEGIRRFYALFYAQRTLAVLEGNARRSQELVDRSEALFEAGRASKADVFSSQVNLNNDRISAIRQESTIAQTSADLSAWIARPEVEDLTAVDPGTLQAPPMGPPALDELLRQARTSRPLLRALDASLRAADTGVDVARGGFYPRLTAQAQWQRQGPYADAVFAMPKLQNTLNAGINFQWDLFSGLSTTAQVHTARANVRSAQLNLEQSARDVEGQVKLGHTTLRVQVAVSQVSRQNVDTAGKGLAAAEARFAAGASSTLEVRDAQLKLTQAELIFLQSRVDVEVARAQLARLTGTLGRGERQ